MFKWLPEVGALLAMFIIARNTEMGMLDAVLLWVALDLMTVTSTQIKRLSNHVSS